MLCCVGSALLSLVELLLLQQLNDSVAALTVELAENRHAQQELAELHLLHLTERMRHVCSNRTICSAGWPTRSQGA